MNRQWVGNIAMGGAIALLWDDVVGGIVEHVFDLRNLGVAMPEVVANIIGLILLGVGVAAYKWPSIQANRKKVPLEDVKTASGRRVFVGQTIDITKMKNHEIENAAFIDCYLHGDGALLLESTVSFAENQYVRASNPEFNSVFLVPNNMDRSDFITLRNVHLMNTQLRAKSIAFTEEFQQFNDPEQSIRYKEWVDPENVG